MGVILDSSVLIAGERRRDSVWQILERVESACGKTVSALSAPLTLEIARLAGRIHGEQMGRGIGIGFADLIIGATALHLSFGVVTPNVKHFQAIPGVSVTEI